MGEDNSFIKWFPVGARSMLALQDDLLVEYDMATSVSARHMAQHGEHLQHSCVWK